MKLSQLSKEPQLIEMSLDDEEIVKEYGEPLVFYTWDRQPMDVFTKLANLSEKNDVEGLLNIVRDLVMEEDGSKILQNNATLPTPILMKVIGKITEQMGK